MTPGSAFIPQPQPQVWAILNAQLADGTVTDIVVDGAQLARVGEHLQSLPLTRYDATGKLLLPTFIDTHVHLDKVLVRNQISDHDGTLPSAISAIQRLKALYTIDDVRHRAKQAIESSVINGTTRLRSHVDVDSIGGLTPLAGVAAAASECESVSETQLIAFPQEGLIRDSGAMELMQRAMLEGAEVVGGMPHWETNEIDQRKHVRFCFDLAERFDAPLDMHVDETDDGSVRTLETVADEALRRGWHGRISAGHVCALAAADEEYAKRVIDKCARVGMTIVSNPTTNLMIQGRGDRGLIRRGLTRIRELRAAGINIAFGQDCINDGFYPFGRGSMVEVALIAAHAAHLSTRDELLFALQAVTDAPARAWGLTDYGIHAGARADLQIFSSPTWAEVLRMQSSPEAVWYRGRQVASTTSATHLMLPPLQQESSSN